MRKKFSVGIALVLGLVFSMSACDNEVDINADWKEILVVYGLLDPLDSVQYIKVNKAFLNENENALKVAQNPDSLFLKDARVTLLHINSGKLIELQRVNEIPKPPGVFAQDPNYLYKTTEPILENEPYKLVVESSLTGQKIQAVTWTLKKARIEAPFKSSNPTFSLGAKFIVISYVPGWNSYAYDIKMRVKIDELVITVEAEATEEVPSVYKAMHITYTFKGEGLDETKLSKAVQLSHDKYCGVSMMYERFLKISWEIKITP